MQGPSSNLSLLPRWRGKQRRIGITGGIASGKSSVANYLYKNKKLPIIDADLYSHQVLAPGTSSTKAIIKRYGNKVIENKDTFQSKIDRLELRNIIFRNTNERIWLEQLIHPIILDMMNKKIKEEESKPILILVIPLLFELKLTGLCSEVWTIDCKLEQQLERLVRRGNIKKDIAIKMIESQIPLQEKKRLADVIINNSNTLEECFGQVDQLI